jgi:hypothetical protein
MRGLRRHKDEHGLDEKGRTLIHSYMANQPERTEPEIETSPPEAPPAAVEQRPRAAAEVEAEIPAGVALGVVTPVPESRAGIDVSRRTLEQVARLCEQLDWSVRAESPRRRARLAAAGPRANLPPGGGRGGS